MEERTEYKSSIRSRKLIRSAFVDLLTEKRIEKITVTDIVNRAEINRGTFYAHYQDTQELLENIERNISNELVALIDAAGGMRGFYLNPHPLLKELVAFISADRVFYQKLLSGNGSSSLKKCLRDTYSEFLCGDFSVSEAIKNMPTFKIRHLYVSYGIYAVIEEWLSGSLNVTDDELVAICSDLVNSCKIKEDSIP